MTYVIIDIDGVLNPFGARHNAQLNFIWLEKENQGVFLKPDMHIPWITKISEHATFIWGSAWAKRSNLVLDVLELDQQWDYIPLVEPPEDFVGTWKLKSVKEWVENNAPTEKIVWLDDELQEDAFQWSKGRSNMLTICPDRYEGLTEDDFKKVYEFIIN